MSPVINATATKPSPSSEIGIYFGIQDHCVKITKVVKGGLFSKSGLEEGQEIITINGTHVDDLSKDEVTAIIASIETEINITARPKPFNAFFKIKRRVISPVINATATKPSPSSKIGVVFGIQQDPHCVKITKVVKGGLFSKSGLEEGQEVITINGTHVDGLSKDEVTAIIASIETKINITAKTKPNPRDPTRAYHDMNCNPDELPIIMKAAGVPPHKWRKIYQLIESELVEATWKSVEMDEIYDREMYNYTNKQMAKGYVGLGFESSHERKALLMTHQCAALANNATLAATDVSIHANAFLAPHGILASLYLVKAELPIYSTKQKGGANFANKPYGLRFVSLE